MGINNSRENCEHCLKEYGETAVLEIYHHGEIGGRFLCIWCFEKYLKNNKYLSKTIKKNTKTKIGKCVFCSNKNINEFSDHNFKVYWNGKYNNLIMCQKCLFNKPRRRNYNYFKKQQK